MEKNKLIIIALIVIIIAILAIVATFSMESAKTDTKIYFMSNESLSHDDYIKVGLQAEFDNLAGKTIHFKFIDDKGNVSEYSVDTDVNGKAKLNLKDIDAGNYTVNVTFEGDDKYNPSSTSQKLEIKDNVVEETVTQQSTQSPSSSDDGLYYDEEINVYYDSNGIIVDPDGQHFQGAGESYNKYRDARDRWERGEPVMV